MLRTHLFRTAILTLLALSACAKSQDKAPFVSDLKLSYTAEATKTTSQLTTSATLEEVPGKPAGSLVGEVTLRKASILGRTFNYSASLQFSSIVDGDLATALLGLSLGEVPANFQIFNDKLRLVTDGSINFESDVNKPARLIYEFPILTQTAETITIRADRASPIMDTFLFGSSNKVPVRYSFLRSMEFAEADELILMESTVELTDGSVGEFMESLRPREKTIPANFEPIYNDSELSEQADRYGFLDSGDVYIPKKDKPSVRVKTKAAMRFAPNNSEPVKWYVTANIPDAYIGDVKNGVEAWNRYTRAAGLPDLVRFEGRLPDGVKVGDPRYNLIVWDTVQDAGAAYESQNADPVTGVISHSMIYLPYAWVNIGKDYWKKVSPGSQAPGELRAARIKRLLKNRDFLGRRLPVNCMDQAEMHITAEAQQNPEQFGRSLLKAVVFHEMGHALGLAHNFKGSLTFDSTKPESSFSSSVMDYNHYDEEDAAFTSLESSDGPILEYDRQIISVLYNGGKDVKEDAEEVPHCTDEDADSDEGGVDPFCIRYDIGNDITVEALRRMDLFSKPGMKYGRSSSLTAQKVTDALLALPAAAEQKDLDAVKAAINTGITAVTGSVGVYISGGAGSFAYMGGESLRVLKVFRDGTLPEGVDENELRGRALTILETAESLNEYPALTKEAVSAAKPALLTYVNTTPYVSGLGNEEKEKAIASLTQLIDRSLASMEAKMLSRMRTRFIEALASTPNAPLAFVSKGGATVDVELTVMQTLARLASQKAGAGARPVAERTAALTSLKSYKRSENYKPIAERIVQDLTVEVRSSTDALQKEALRGMLAAFTSGSAAE